MNIHIHQQGTQEALMFNALESQKNALVSFEANLDELISKTDRSYQMTPKTIGEWETLRKGVFRLKIALLAIGYQGELQTSSCIECFNWRDRLAQNAKYLTGKIEQMIPTKNFQSEEG